MDNLATIFGAIRNWLKVEQVESGRFELVAATQSVTALKGLIRKPAMPVTIEAMNETIAFHGAKARIIVEV